MKVYLQPTGTRVEPFDDPMGELPVQNRPLAWWQAQAFEGAGLSVIADKAAPCLVVPDNLFTTAEALRRFLVGANGRNAVLVLKRSRFGEETTPVQLGLTEVDEGWRFDAIRFESGGDEEPVEVVVDPDETINELPMPRAFVGSDTQSMSLARVPVVTIHHWVHLLWVNQMAGGVELLATPRWKLVLRGIWALLRALSFNKWKILAKFSTFGKGCSIHPTAVVEACTVGNDVTVGAFAHVQFCNLADGVTILPGAQVVASVLGERAWVSEQCVLRFSVLYPGAVVSQPIMQHCILGRDVATTGGSGTIDFNFEGPIKVALAGKLRSTGARFLGSAFGHRSKIGAGILLAAGRTIPNDTVLIGDPNAILTQIPKGHEGVPLIGSSKRARPVHLLRANATPAKPGSSDE